MSHLLTTLDNSDGVQEVIYRPGVHIRSFSVELEGSGYTAADAQITILDSLSGNNYFIVSDSKNDAILVLDQLSGTDAAGRIHVHSLSRRDYVKVIFNPGSNGAGQTNLYIKSDIK